MGSTCSTSMHRLSRNKANDTVLLSACCHLILQLPVCRESYCMSSPRSCWYHTSHRNQLGTIAQESCLKSFMFSTASIIWFTFSLLPFLVFHCFVSLHHSHIISTPYASPRPSYMQKSCRFFHHPSARAKFLTISLVSFLV